MSLQSEKIFEGADERMKRHFYQADGVELSYVDFGGPSERTLVALHGHFGTATMFAQLARAIQGWRLVALDQRGHGWSAHVDERAYSRETYRNDLHVLIEKELGGMPVVLLGHSLGGVNAYQFAAHYPNLVKALIIEDIGAEVADDQNWVKRLLARVPSIRELRQSLECILGAGAFSYFEESVVEYPDGWTVRFDAEGIIHSQEYLNGSWWEDWLASSCPALLMQGERSPILSWELAQRMAKKRPNTSLLQFPECGHTIRNGDPDGYFDAVNRFLHAFT
ncbi:alpha/beta fold hydrolase [Brevibacillus fluminis]|uniref:alpha/beta fold hydrolase n=1 Tax=Brevibacillus fluminis TaxID=511487 RepID=UPI003F88C99C